MSNDQLWVTWGQSFAHNVAGVGQSHMRVTGEPRNDVGSLSPTQHEAGFEQETHSIFTCSKLTIETLEQGVKYVQSWQ